jgi:hypothetical protein
MKTSFNDNCDQDLVEEMQSIAGQNQTMETL